MRDSALGDTAFSGINAVLRDFETVEVLRYRPGKRLTLAAIHPEHGACVVKAVRQGAAAIRRRLHAVWVQRAHFEFAVSQPLPGFENNTVFVQTRLPGNPLSFSKDSAGPLARNVAHALVSLHQSATRFVDHFTASDQRARSERYRVALRTVAGIDRNTLDRLMLRLDNLQAALAPEIEHCVPGHGSPHTGQWLVSEGRLALVDFDRAALCDPALDVGTFLAEWDFEPGPMAATIHREFEQAYRDAAGSVCAHAVAFYRYHKHLAKAYKAVKHQRDPVCVRKANVRLAGALSALRGELEN